MIQSRSHPSPASARPAARFRGTALGLGVLLLAACPRAEAPGALVSKEPAMPHPSGPMRIVLLHHSTGGIVWKGGVARFIEEWNGAHGTHYEITELTYPGGTGGHPWLGRILPDRLFKRIVRDRYPWSNYPYDYWNLWVAHQGEHRDRAELNLDDLVRSYDVIVFKHCFSVSRIQADDGAPSVSSPTQTLANFKLQYEALKARLHQFPRTTFILWTGPALVEGPNDPAQAERARQFAAWVKGTWDQPGDNIYLWDFRELETGGGLFLKPAEAEGPRNSHPSRALAARTAPRLGRRIVDVVEGRGDVASLTGG